jgi:nitrous oxide reductase
MNHKRVDYIYFLLVLFVVIALPFAIFAYDRQVWDEKIPADAKVFSLTGNAQKGWVVGSIDAAHVLTTSLSPVKPAPPVLKVKKGDTVVIKLTSSDVVHGFSFKDFGIFVNGGIHPGKPQTVVFVADKEGSFRFVCNSICGNHHEDMYGTLIVQI